MTPLGIKNCNPCNIRVSSSPWVGKITPQPGAQFEEFDTALDGIRAAAKIIISYFKKYGLCTVQSIISRWAPSNENNTLSYINDVAIRMSADPNETLDMTDPQVIYQLINAIIFHENGYNPYDYSAIISGVNEALT